MGTCLSRIKNTDISYIHKRVKILSLVPRYNDEYDDIPIYPTPNYMNDITLIAS
jgi:hypothetical protein